MQIDPPAQYRRPSATRADVVFATAAVVMLLFPPWTTETRWRDETGHGLGKWKPDTVHFEGYHLWGYQGEARPDSQPDIVKINGAMPQNLDPYIPAKQPRVAVRSGTTTSVNYMILMTQLVLLFGLRRLATALAERVSRFRPPSSRR